VRGCGSNPKHLGARIGVTLVLHTAAFTQWLMPLRQCEWVVYAKRPFAGPAAVLAYLSRYTHRVAISNRRLLALDERGVTFRWKDYRAHGRRRHKTMTLSAEEFMRRFLLHVAASAIALPLVVSCLGTGIIWGELGSFRSTLPKIRVAG
jgi:hypothetical protein